MIEYFLKLVQNVNCDFTYCRSNLLERANILFPSCSVISAVIGNISCTWIWQYGTYLSLSLFRQVLVVIQLLRPWPHLLIISYRCTAMTSLYLPYTCDLILTLIFQGLNPLPLQRELIIQDPILVLNEHVKAPLPPALIQDRRSLKPGLNRNVTVHEEMLLLCLLHHSCWCYGKSIYMPGTYLLW